MESLNANSEVFSPGALVSQGFAGRSVQHNHGTADTAMAAQIKAQVEARYLMAMHKPRDLDLVRERLLKECRRPHFARGAMYDIPRGKSRIRGLSIRFAEAAVGCMTNINAETLTLYDDKKKRVLRVQVTDVENNQTYSRDITIEKSVERRQAGRGQEILGTRTNSFGDRLFLVAATEEELNTKESALVSKTLRTLILRIVPGWLQDEAQETILATAARADAQDPDAAKRRICDMFAALGISPMALKEYLGREDLDPMPPQEMQDLRLLHAALREGQVRWGDVLSDVKAARRDLAAAPGEAPDKAGSRNQAALAKLTAKKAPEAPAKAPNPQALAETAPAATQKPQPQQARAPEPEPWSRFLDEKPEGIDS